MTEVQELRFYYAAMSRDPHNGQVETPLSNHVKRQRTALAEGIEYFDDGELYKIPPEGIRVVAELLELTGFVGLWYSWDAGDGIREHELVRRISKHEFADLVRESYAGS